MSADSKQQALEDLRSLLKHWTVSIECEAEDPESAILFLMSLIEDPDSAHIKIDWVVTERETGVQHRLNLSCAELNAMARQYVDYVIKALKAKGEK